MSEGTAEPILYEWRFAPPMDIGKMFVARCPACGCDQEITGAAQEGIRVSAEISGRSELPVKCRACTAEMFAIADYGGIVGWALDDAICPGSSP